MSTLPYYYFKILFSYATGLMLRSGEIGAAAEAWPVGIFGLV